MLRRRSPNLSVRRQLFPIQTTEEKARNDNFTNKIQEELDRDKKEKMTKWNFDTEKEIPLEGNIQWFRKNGSNDWIGVYPEVETSIDCNANMKEENEVTPKVKAEDADLVLKKRKRVDEEKDNTGEGVKKKLTFD